MARLPDNYLGPKHRIEMLKKDFGHAAAILTEAKMMQVGEALCVMFVATIKINGEVIANGHAFTDTPEENKAVEKAETIAIGRALVNAGYPELDDGNWEEKTEKLEVKPAVKPPKEKETKKDASPINIAPNVSGVGDVVSPEMSKPVSAPALDAARSGLGPVRSVGIPKGLGTGSGKGGTTMPDAKQSVPAVAPAAKVEIPAEVEAESVAQEDVQAEAAPAQVVTPTPAVVADAQPTRLSGAELLAKYKK